MKRLESFSMKTETYNIYIDNKKVHSNLSEEKYFDILEDYAQEFYKTGIPHPNSVSFKIIQEN